LFLLFVPLSSQRVSSNSCQTLRELLTDPKKFTKLLLLWERIVPKPRYFISLR